MSFTIDFTFKRLIFKKNYKNVCIPETADEEHVNNFDHQSNRQERMSSSLCF